MSSKITSQKAKEMVGAYLAHSNTVKTLNSSSEEVTLKGLTIDRESLEAILNPGDESQINQVFLALAVQESDLTKPETEQYYTLVAIGIDDQNNLKIDNAYDHAEKCPMSCPANYNNIFM